MAHGAWAQDSLVVEKQLYDFKFRVLDGQKTKLPPKSIIILLDTECPICQKYTLKIKALAELCQQEQISLIGVFLGKVNKEEIRLFKSKYQFAIPMIIDAKLRIPKALKATTTPEVFLINQEKILYRGLIDNWFYMLGRSRPEPTEHYLIEAIQAYKAGRTIELPKTSPIGCLISYQLFK